MTVPSILSAASRATLASFLRDNVLLAFDFDGVLAPIVPTRDRAHLRLRTRVLLVRLAQRFPCIVVSGRQLADLSPRLDGVPLRMLFGNFGYEPPLDGHRPPPVVARWVVELRERFHGQRGIDVEDKGYSVAVHYRRAADPDRARVMIEETLAEMRGGRVLEGTLAVMLIPKAGPTKGSTLQAARRRLKCERAIYLGDDGTDEDAFASASPECLLSIRVGTAQTGASFRLERQADLDTLLVRMLAMSRP